MNESKGQYWIRQDQAPLFANWIAQQGGVAIWRSLDLKNPDREWATPAFTPDGQPSPAPHRMADPTPKIVFTSMDQILVALDKEVERLPIAVEPAAGNSFKLTKHSADQVREAQRAAGEGAYYEFDYGSKEAVILAPERTVSLGEWVTHQNTPI